MAAAVVPGMLRFQRRLRHQSRPVMGSLLVVACLQACSYVRDQVAITSASQCVDRECRDEVGAARPQCEAECHRRYSR